MIFLPFPVQLLEGASGPSGPPPVFRPAGVERLPGIGLGDSPALRRSGRDLRRVRGRQRGRGSHRSLRAHRGDEGIPDLRFRDLTPVIIKSSVLVGDPDYSGGLFRLTSTLITEEIPTKILDFMRNPRGESLVFLLWLNLFSPCRGLSPGYVSRPDCAGPNGPPCGHAYGIHPVHLGMILLTNWEIGASLPPLESTSLSPVSVSSVRCWSSTGLHPLHLHPARVPGGHHLLAGSQPGFRPPIGSISDIPVKAKTFLSPAFARGAEFAEEILGIQAKKILRPGA